VRALCCDDRWCCLGIADRIAKFIDILFDKKNKKNEKNEKNKKKATTVSDTERWMCWCIADLAICDVASVGRCRIEIKPRGSG